jgi:hypothetical protein
MDSSYVFEIRVYDPVKGTCERLPPIDDPHFVGIVGWFQCTAMNWKLSHRQNQKEAGSKIGSWFCCELEGFHFFHNTSRLVLGKHVFC